NTIVAKNQRFKVVGGGGVLVSDDLNGAVTSDSAFNLIGNGTGMTGINHNDANHNQVGVSAGHPGAIDPLLSPLGYYGGLTQTLVLSVLSPARDAGSDFGLTEDQRGFARTVGGQTDIGAIEFNSAIVVNTTVDASGPLGPGVISLREAINMANAIHGG